MSGTWTDSLGNPRDPNEPTDEADIYTGDPDATGFVIANGGLGDDTLIGGGGNQILGGGEGNDSLQASSDGDELYGNEGHDTLRGGDAADLLSGGAGDDVIDGGSGPDTIGLSGSPQDYIWTALPGGGWTVTDTLNRDGTDTVGADVEWVYYAEPNITQAPACFLEGTRIMTRGGEVPVEALRVGDLALALGPAGPRFAPIRWIGHRRIDLARHPAPERARPIRIPAGTLAPGVPARDLRVSPDHALYIDDALVPAGLLDGAAGIAADPAPRRFRYFHVELDRHAVLLADGAPAESYLDDGNRAQFENAGLVVALHPDFAVTSPHRKAGCAPRLGPGAALEAIVQRLAGRASDPIAFRQAG